jgi:uncharacterized membrane protein
MSPATTPTVTGTAHTDDRREQRVQQRDRRRGAPRATVTEAGDGSRVEIEYNLPGGVLGEAVGRFYAERRNGRETEHTLEKLNQLLEGEPN